MKKLILTPKPKLIFTAKPKMRLTPKPVVQPNKVKYTASKNK